MLPTRRLLRSRMWKPAGAVAAVIALFACQPGELLTVEDTDIVITGYDDSFDFSVAVTWAMPDSVVAVDPEGTQNLYDHSLDQVILDQIAANMAARGYTRENDPEANGADLVILPQVIVTQNVTAYSWYPWDPYWGWYPGWDYWGGLPGYGSWYPWAPSLEFRNLRVGTILIEAVDPNADGEAEEGPSATIRWAAVLNGLAQGGSGSTRAVDGIDQAFAQSPYFFR